MKTPVFTVSTAPFTDGDGDGEPDAMQFRMRVVEPGGHARGHVFTLNGHAWQREPYINGSSEIGDDFRTHNSLDLSAGTHNVDGPAHNMKSWWVGSQEGLGAGSHFDFVPRKTGGMFATPGDYLFSDFGSFGRYQGLWGIVRFADPPPPPPNEPPTANDDDVEAKEPRGRQDTRTTGLDVLANDSDPDGDPLTVTRIMTPLDDLPIGVGVSVTLDSGATVELNADGTLAYTTSAPEGSLDSFEYQVCDPGGLCTTATVNVTIVR